MDEKTVVLPTHDDSNRSKDLLPGPALLFSIGQQRFEIRVTASITPLRRRPAEVISIARQDRQ
jgi:hypothetical protein